MKLRSDHSLLEKYIWSSIWNRELRYTVGLECTHRLRHSGLFPVLHKFQEICGKVLSALVGPVSAAVCFLGRVVWLTSGAC